MSCERRALTPPTQPLTLNSLGFSRAMNIRCTLLLILAASFVLFSANAAEPSPYSRVRSARHFTIGGVGFTGVKSQEELAMRTIRDSPRAQERLRSLLEESTPAGQMYALFALRQLSPADYPALAEPFRSRSSPVPTISGCIIFTQRMSQAVRWIDHWAKKMRAWEK
jgi:hypothetical protein